MIAQYPTRRRPAAGLRRATCLAAAALVAACAGAPHGHDAARGVPHAERRFVVTEDAHTFRVHVRYVPMLSETVIAVQQGTGPGGTADWPELAVSVPDGPGAGEFDGPAGRTFALAVAAAAEARSDICPGGRHLGVVANGAGRPETMYRPARGAWIVFARCAPPAGAGS